MKKKEKKGGKNDGTEWKRKEGKKNKEIERKKELLNK